MGCVFNEYAPYQSLLIETNLLVVKQIEKGEDGMEDFTMSYDI